MNELILLTDYRGCFYSSIRNKDTLCTMDVAALRKHFAEFGCETNVKTFADVDLRNERYADRIVLYTSSEDNGLRYRSYIEDVVYGLSLQGARLIPRYPLFRAHHNKAFMEILRDLSDNPAVKSLRAKSFGTYEECVRAGSAAPAVVKPAAGAGSRSVKLARDAGELAKIVKTVAKVRDFKESCKEIAKSWLRRGYVRPSKYRNKFIVQDFVPGLAGDYKILAYYDKYYALHRKNRAGDFRASGSGRFEKPATLPEGLLDFARAAFESFDTPLVSMDIAFDGAAFYLIEFQFLSFGPYTLETSDFYFVREHGAWRRIDEPSALEREFARAIARYLSK
ncbi:MAG: hypothetical protein IT426_17285 [Pirellulales bacterium]|nr:hypothetical protein [Pirellulales bacterium]